MTRQTWTAAVSALLFVVLAAVIALVPVPYVTWAPGATYNLLGPIDGKDAITINGIQTYPVTGELRMTTISVTAPDASLSLPEVLISYWMPDHLVLPREAIYHQGASVTDLDNVATQQMSASQTYAIVAALRAAQVPVTELPMVDAVQKAGPSAGSLQAGDLIQAVDGVAVSTQEQAAAAIRNRHVGQRVTFSIVRNGQLLEETVTTRASDASPDIPMVGIDIATGYLYGPKVTFAIDPSVGGASAGMMFTLAIYDRITKANLANGQVIAGTGTVDADGKVGAIGGVAEKLAAAQRDHATVFILPKSNCVNVGTAPTGMRLVAVSSVNEAIGSLRALADPSTAGSVAGCS